MAPLIGRILQRIQKCTDANNLDSLIHLVGKMLDVLRHEVIRTASNRTFKESVVRIIAADAQASSSR
jgi:hypothetical protein